MSSSIAINRVASHDGTEIAYYTAGDPRGGSIVLCGGLGGGITIWRPFFTRFAERFRVIGWDYRGLYRSAPPADPDAYSVAHHVGDLLHLLEHEGVESPLLVGWSMGVQLGLELHRTHPDLLKALVSIHGAAGSPLATAFDSPLSSRLSPYVLALMRRVGNRFGAIGPHLARSRLFVRAFVWTGQLLGVMAPSLDVGSFRDIGEDWTRLDMSIYADIFEHLERHDASDLLGSIQTPALIIAGGRDRFTPAHLSQRMAEKMPNATLEILRGATHFGLLEFPDEILDCVEQFLWEQLGLPI